MSQQQATRGNPMNWQELKHALLELFESFSLPFDDHTANDNAQGDLQPILIPIRHDESPRRR